MNSNDILGDSVKKVTVSSLMTYFRSLSIDKQENVLKWAKLSKNVNANINTSNPSEWEKKLKSMFSQLTPKEQAEVVSQATKVLNDKKSH